MAASRPGMTRPEFIEASGICGIALDKIAELGYARPFAVENGRGKEYYYSSDTLHFVKLMTTFLDGKNNLQTACEKAKRVMQG